MTLGDAAPEGLAPGGAGGNVAALARTELPDSTVLAGTLAQSVPVSSDYFGAPVTFSAYASAFGPGSPTLEHDGTGQQHTQAVPGNNGSPAPAQRQSPAQAGARRAQGR